MAEASSSFSYHKSAKFLNNGQKKWRPTSTYVILSVAPEGQQKIKK